MLSLSEMLVLMGIVTSARAELPISKADAFKNNDREIQTTCMADNIYFEARNQGTAGWSAVASVTFNRVKDKRLYKTIKDFSSMILIPGVSLLDITDGATHYHADYVSPAW